MQIHTTGIPGCFEIFPTIAKDDRGSFVKTFHQAVFTEHGLTTQFAEEYYTCSRKRVMRGLHFQRPPMDHIKLVYCVSGRVLDAVVDLRIGSPSYGRPFTFELSADRANMLYLPAGLAHGFYVLSENAVLMYKVTTVYAPQHDSGILWNSVGIPWPDSAPIISPRDLGFTAFKDFTSPFTFEGKGSIA